MAARPSVDIITQLGVETTPGTEVDATKALTALNIEFSPELEMQFARAQGKRLMTSGVKNKAWGSGSFSGIASYIELALLLEGLLGRTAAVENPVSGVATAYRRVFDSNITTNQKSFTAERGDLTAAMVATYLQFSSLEAQFTRDGVNVNGNLFCREPNVSGALTLRNEVQTLTITGTPTGGTFTLTFDGQTTASIAYNASAAAIVSALEALSNIGAGDVTATGGALPGTAVVITFALALAGANQPLLTATSSLTGGSTPAITITQTTQGGYLSSYAEAPISGNEVCVYVDSSAAALGTTLLTDAYDVSFSIPEVLSPKWVLNCNLTSFKESVKRAIEATMVKLTSELNAQTRTLYTALKANSLPVYFVRIECTGPQISGAVNNLARFDFAVKLDSGVRDIGDQDGTYAFEMPLRVVEDAAWGKGFEFTLINTLASI